MKEVRAGTRPVKRTAEPTSADFDKARRKAKQELIAHAAFVRNTAANLAAGLTGALHDLQEHKITEDAAVTSIQDQVIDALHEMQLSVLSQKLMEVAIADQVMRYLRADGR